MQSLDASESVEASVALPALQLPSVLWEPSPRTAPRDAVIKVGGDIRGTAGLAAATLRAMGAFVPVTRVCRFIAGLLRFFTAFPVSPVFHSFLPTQFAPRFADAAGDSLRGGGEVFLAGALRFVGDLVPFHSSFGQSPVAKCR